jgi:hypothetical protein
MHCFAAASSTSTTSSSAHHPLLQVLDSPFSRLTDLMLEIVQQQKLPIPKVCAQLGATAGQSSQSSRQLHVACSGR